MRISQKSRAVFFRYCGVPGHTTHLVSTTIFVTNVTSQMYGPTGTEDGYWRIKTNQEISDILKSVTY